MADSRTAAEVEGKRGVAGIDARQAAIGEDDARGKTLDQISAREFLTALDRDRGAQGLPFTLHKRDIEFILDDYRSAKLRDILDRIRGEKKKVELEIDMGLDWRVQPSAVGLKGLIETAVRGALAGGSTGYTPNPEDDNPFRFPPHIEWKKMHLDRAFERLARLETVLDRVVDRLDQLSQNTRGR